MIRFLRFAEVTALPVEMDDETGHWKQTKFEVWQNDEGGIFALQPFTQLELNLGECQ